MNEAIQRIHDRFIQGLRSLADPETNTVDSRIGAELKFPLVNSNGSAASREMTQALWRYLADQGWTIELDSLAERPMGARRPGERNDSVASVETGYCKVEFSLAHVKDLWDLRGAIDELPGLLRPFAERNDVRFLCLGIHPVTPPSGRLLARKGRAGFWGKVFPSNRVIPPEEGDDYHLFTVNTASHVHISLPENEAIAAVNVLNGFAPAQIALTAHSTVWRGAVDPQYKCVAEKMWDWWKPAVGRVGVPLEAFSDTTNYVSTIAQLKPVYVKREGKPVILKNLARSWNTSPRKKSSARIPRGNRSPLRRFSRISTYTTLAIGIMPAFRGITPWKAASATSSCPTL